MKSYKSILFLFCLAFFLNTKGQTFLKPMKDLNFKKAAAVTIDSTVFSGNMSGASMTMGYLSSVRIKDDSGEVMKVNKESAVRIDVVHQTKLDREDLFENGEITSLKKALNNGDLAKSLGTLMLKSAELKDRLQQEAQYNYLTFERVEMPSKNKKKYKFLQLLNPGFDSRIKVYFKYSGEEADAAKKYFIVKDGGAPLDIKEKDYRDVFGMLFNDCPKMKTLFPNGGKNYQNISVHVYTYDQLCGSM